MSGQQPQRMTLSAAQVEVMNEALAGSPDLVIAAAAKIGRGEVVPDEDAEAVVDALADAMLGDEGFDGESLNQRGVQIDDVIGLVQQMSEHFYD